MRRAALATTAVLAALLALAGTSLGARPDEAGASDLAARIDAKLEASWREAGIEPAPITSDLAYYRRLSLDLLGTLPSLSELRAFEGEPAEGRRARLVARLLEDTRFDEAMAERLARIVVGAGRKPDDLFYRRRRFVEWLRGEVEKRRAWDDIVRELIASEGTSTGAPAVNFVMAADADPVKLAGRTARAFLGVRLDCAQCHDHPFAQWKQHEFEEISAFFARAHRKGPILFEGQGGDYEIHDRKDGKPRVIEPHVPLAPEALPQVVTARKAPADAPHNRRQALARWVTDARNPYFSRAIANRVWAWLMGSGLVEPVDELDVAGSPYPEVLELLAADLREHGFDLVRLVRAIVSTRAFALASSLGPGREGEDQERLVRARALYPLKPLHPDQLASAIWQATSFWPQSDERSLLFRIAKLDQTSKFVARHGGDLDAEHPEDPTLLQRVLIMNGDLVHERTKSDNPFGVVGRLLALAPTDAKLVETAYLMTLSRAPTQGELEHFLGRLANKNKNDRAKAVQDIFWALLNSVEFSWNH